MTSAVTVGGLEVYIRDETSRFTTAMMRAGTMVDQQSARMNRSLQNVSSSATRMNRSLDGINSNAFRALALSALRAEDNTKRLENTLIAVSALATGLSGAFVIRGLAEASDQYRNIQNRIAVTTNSESERVILNERIYEIARASRSEYQATAVIFARLAGATSQLGVSMADVLRVTEAVQKSFVVSGSTTQEAQASAIQLAQGLASGRLQGDELKSILENNLVLNQLLSRELAGGSSGRLREMGEQGLLTPDMVFAALLKGVSEIDAAFQQTLPTIQQGIVAINTALTRFVGENDEALGISLALGQGLKALADNFDAIATAALLAGTAIATSLLGGRVGAAFGGGMGIAAAIKAERQEAVNQAQALRRTVANEIVRTRTTLDSLRPSGGGQQITATTSVFASADAAAVNNYQRAVIAATKATDDLGKQKELAAARSALLASAEANYGQAIVRNSQQLAAAQGTLATATNQVATAKAAATRAAIAMATAQRIATSAAVGLFGLLGGPAGIALTAATLGLIAYMNNTAQAAAREEKWAEALKRRAEAMGAANAAAAVDVQISQQSRAVAEAQREAAQAQADLLSGARNVGFEGLMMTAELRNQLASLAREAGNGTLAFGDFKAQIDKLRESGQITADLAARMIKLAENVEGAKARADELKAALDGLQDKKVNLTVQVEVQDPNGVLRLVEFQGAPLAPGGLDKQPDVKKFDSGYVPYMELDQYDRLPSPPGAKPNIESFAPSRSGGGRRSKEEREADRLKKQYDSLIKAGEDQRKSLEMEAKAYGMTEKEAERFRAEQEFLIDAQRLGGTLYKDNEEAIKKMAAALGEASVKAFEAQQAQQKLREQQEFYAGITKGFFSDVLGAVRNGEDVWQSFANAALSALDKIMDRLLSMAIDEIFKSMFQGGGLGAGGGNFFASFFKALGFARGGYVDGPGTATSDSIPARLSKGEFVVNAAATRQNLGLLQAINSGRATQMLASGGMAGMSRSVAGIDGGGGATINMKVINQAPGVEAVPGTDSAGNPTLIVRQVEGALAKRVGTRQSAIGRAANAPLRG